MTTKWLKNMKSKLNDWVKEKLVQEDDNSESYNEFIIQHFQNNKCIDAQIDIESVDQRRTIFISLIGLYQTWSIVPSLVLYSSIFIIPLKQEWIYDTIKYQTELQNYFLSKIRPFDDSNTMNSSEIKEFIQLLQWKDSQGLVAWTMNDYTFADIIHPFWHTLNDTLCNSYDAVTGNKYKPLCFDAKWWQNTDSFISEYNTKTESVLSEFYFLRLKYKPMQEILYQSNPNSLNVVKAYRKYAVAKLILPTTNGTDLFDNIDDNEKVNWVFTDQYDPYDSE